MIKIDEKLMLNEAIEASKNSYSPYSNFKVGAAILLKNGEVIRGTNIENAAYPSGICAERCAMFTTYAKGFKKSDIIAISIVGDTEKPIAPCGACRQVMVELLDMNTPVYLFNLKGDLTLTSVKELVPYSFDGGDL